MQSCNRVYTAAAVFSPVSLVSFGTHACSLHVPIPGQAAGPRVPSQLGPVRAFHPSGLQAERNLYHKVFLDRGSKIGSTSLSLASDVDSDFCKAASARIKVAFR